MIELDVVTPAKQIVVGAKVPSVTLPTIKGQTQVLPGHTELLTVLQPGELSFVEDGVTRRFAVSYGFAEVRNDRIIVLAETAEEAREIDRARAVSAQKRAEDKLRGMVTEDEFRKHQLKLQRALIRQNLSS